MRPSRTLEAIQDETIVVRKNEDGRWHLKGVPEESMSSRELYAVLMSLGIGIEDLAFMRGAFQEEPDANEAHFGILGEFLYVTNYYQGRAD